MENLNPEYPTNITRSTWVAIIGSFMPNLALLSGPRSTNPVTFTPLVFLLIARSSCIDKMMELQPFKELH